jgi:hypothetical protein
MVVMGPKAVSVRMVQPGVEMIFLAGNSDRNLVEYRSEAISCNSRIIMMDR